MKIIDIDTWRRREHFHFFKRMAYPIYNICFEIEVTKVKHFSTENSLPFNLVMVHLSTASFNDVENFRYRIREEKVVLHDSLTPSYADAVKNSDLFRMITVPFDMDLKNFVTKAKLKSQSQTQYFVVEDFSNNDNFVFYSAIPWISFTSVDHTRNHNRDDAMPRVSWGKYHWQENKLFLPYNIQVNHMFVDGIHLGMFKENIENRINAL
jgi:chloramphenicol O-acetyltransferase type A